jgi:hypothetical protein
VPPTLGYTYDAKSYSYRHAGSGRFVSSSEVRRAIDGALDANAARMRGLADALRERRISLADWQTQMMREIKNVHLWGAALSRGGWSQMTPADYGRVGQRIRVQYEFLRKRAGAIATGAQALDGSLNARAALYAYAGRATFHATETREMELRGMTEERSVRDAADSCDDCVSAEAQGWQPIGTLPLPGERECRGHCLCSLEFR